jgi:heptosyltransferase-1
MRALIIKTSALGDIVQTFPVVEYLKARQGVDEIGWVVEASAGSLVRAHPLIDRVIEVDTHRIRSIFPSVTFVRECRQQRSLVRESSWDVLFDFQGNIKSGLVTWCARAKTKVGYGIHSVPEWPNILATNKRLEPPSGLSARESYLALAKAFFEDTRPFQASGVELRLTQSQERALSNELARWPKSMPVWIISGGSAWPNKMCRAETMVQVLRYLRDAYGPYFIFVAGTGEELRTAGYLAEEFLQSSHVLYRPDLPVLQRMMGHAGAVLAVDSLILHLAGTTKTPAFGFFGPSRAYRYAPPGAGHFQGQCPKNITFDHRCPHLRTCESGACLKDADVDDLTRAIRHWQEEIL